ncbi:hypothetical protein [Hyunsoonleella pacifica]|uniref:Outer membrane protein beta-barrel domain-containing protein n=1 Tax=Hyunsoonleella pacifica TaxID=1080224 RepID=A0A4Q9FPF8_9FLAO|nr:hypothetical protein [Hyunsoonleella pacifica]TBN16780.1 hypothetical protein EYD46_09130 [Hyunsoonleella pacifica]GGD16445.1 hypothetical protein GCM10011368_18030 [Hyunsoonleella pacifica]
MGDKKHIDRLYQEHFKDFEVQPDDTVWNNIEAKLNEKKKKQRVIPIWWRYAGVAALLAVMLTIGVSLFNNDEVEQITPQIVDTEQTDIENTINENLQNSSDTNSEAKNSVIAEDKTEVETNDILKSTKGNNTNSSFNQTKKVNKNIIPKEQSSSIANTNTNEETYKKTFKAPSKDDNPAIITYKDHITKTEIANLKDNSEKETSSTQESRSDKHKTNLVKNTIVTKQNNTITSDKENTEHKTTVPVENKAKQEVAENNTKEGKQSIGEAIEQNKSLLEEEKTEVAFNKWSVAPNVAPVYFSSLGKGSSIGAQFNENSKSGEVNMSYGLNASYAINKRLTVRSGINRVNLGYNTNDVVVFSTVNASASTQTLRTISGTVTNNTAGTSAISAGDNVAIMSANTFKSNNITPFEATNTSINQSFGFIEVPLELQYTISNKRLGLNVIGGFSSLFLNNYESASVIEGQRTLLQENDTSINNTSYSANFGLGVNYKISEKINLNFEPMFKYQINTFRNTSGDFQPFFIGVYTGFGIKF